MPQLQTLLNRVKQRRQSSPVVSVGMRGLLLSWKAIRCVPGTQYFRVKLTADGHRFWVRPFSYDDLLTVSPEYESILNRWRPQPGDTVIDAGAFIGRHTLAYAREVGPTGRVIAIEPHPANFQILQRNVQANRYQNITCVQGALSNHTGQGRLAYDRETSTSALSSRQTRTVPVRVCRLDDLLSELQVSQVDLMKVDVEGAELEVLQGGTSTLSSEHRPRLIIENHHPSNSKTHSDCPVHEWLAQRDFDVESVTDNERHFYITGCGQRPHGEMTTGGETAKLSSLPPQ